VRSITLHFARLEQLERALSAGDFELDAPPGETLADGEWLLVMFEIAGGARRTAAAGKAVVRHEHASLRFAERDWKRLEDFSRDVDTTPTLPPEPVVTEAPASRQTISSMPPSIPAPASASVPPLRTSGFGARVLVVDDEPLVRDMVGTMLEAVGLVVETADSAEHALERARSSPFDLLVLDWHLAGITGIELCRAIRRDAKLDSMPVLFLTANSSSRDMVEAFASGADDYVVKPFRAPELGARIFGLLRRARRPSTSG
jgi:two-component system phosphate regulon response regulator PhoB